MIRLAIRNLRRGRARLALSVGGVGLALTLVFALDAIFTGSERRITAYIDNSGADVWVSQAGVRTLHMSASALPAQAADAVQGIAGVSTVTPVLYLTNRIDVGGERSLAYIIGLPADARVGRPWRVSEGSDLPSAGEAIIDRGVAEKGGAGLGSSVTILGRRLTVVGLSDRTATITNSIAYIALSDFRALRGGDAASFLLVTVEPGRSPDGVAAAIEGAVPGVTAQTRQAFAAQERRVVRDMATDILAIMNAAGSLIGLAVMALSVYTATLSRRSEYGVLKAVGAGPRHLYVMVIAQALIGTAAGYALGLSVTLALSVVVPRLVLGLDLAVGMDSLLKVAGLSAAIAGLSAILPIRQIAGLDPALVFRKGAMA
jgi:putative ABC transport system permease protein